MHWFKRRKWTAQIVFIFNNIKITSPMGVQKQVGAFQGVVYFRNTANNPVTVDHLTSVQLVSSDESIATVLINPATGLFSGNGLKAGTVTLTLTAINDVGNAITPATTDITFTDVPDNTAVSGIIQVS